MSFKRSLWAYHINTGSCIPPGTELILEDGEIVDVEELVEERLGGSECTWQDERVVATRLWDRGVLSWDNFSPEIKTMTQVHKLRAPAELVEIRTRSGCSLKLTPNHKVLVDRGGGPEWVPASDMNAGDYVYSPRSINVSQSVPRVIDCLSGDWIIRVSKKKMGEIKTELKRKHGTIKAAAQKLGINYKRLTSSSDGLKLSEIKVLCDDYNDVLGHVNEVSVSPVTYRLPSNKLVPELFYLAGLISSDGFISITRDKTHANYKIGFDNTRKELADAAKHILSKWAPSSRVSVRKSVEQPNLYRVVCYSRALVEILNHAMSFQVLFKLPEEHIAAFVSGYFDGDGHITLLREAHHKTEKITIGISTANEVEVRHLKLLLNRLGIASRIESAVNKSTFGTNTMWRVSITDHHDVSRFISLVRPRHEAKAKKFTEARRVLGQKSKIQSSFNSAPSFCGPLIKKIRTEHGICQTELNKSNSLISHIESGKHSQKHIIRRTAERLRELTHDKRLDYLLKAVDQQYFLDKVVSLNRVPSKNEYVYDITVDGTHTFIPSMGFVVKNCNGCDIEIIAALTPRYDVERFGIKLVGSPRHADVLMITGPVTAKMKEEFLRVYAQVPAPKVTLCIGNCGGSTGVFNHSYSIRGPMDTLIPVDVYVPGCPPRPEAIIYGVVQAWKKLEAKE